MKSIKPGRAPSRLGFIGSICAAAFGVLWILLALKMRSGPFALFGLPFVILAVALAIYHFRNANGENRYSLYDITGDGEEPDPLNEAVKKVPQPQSDTPPASRAYCPYCGAKTQPDHSFCRNCGKRLP